MQTETKVCPFRSGKDGEFLPCYGEKCMAYYEYEQPVYPVNAPLTVVPSVKRCACYNLTRPVHCGGYCV